MKTWDQLGGDERINAISIRRVEILSMLNSGATDTLSRDCQQRFKVCKQLAKESGDSLFVGVYIGKDKILNSELNALAQKDCQEYLYAMDGEKRVVYWGV